MNNTDSQVFESYVPVYDAVPEKWEDAREFLVEHLKKISNAVNIREIGWYLDEELLSGKQFIPSNAQALVQGTAPLARTVLRKVVDMIESSDPAMTSLPNAGILRAPHGITFDANFTLLHLYAAATDPVNFLAFEIDHAETAPGNVTMFMDQTYIYIITSSNRTSYTRCYAVVEYIQEI